MPASGDGTEGREGAFRLPAASGSYRATSGVRGLRSGGAEVRCDAADAVPRGTLPGNRFRLDARRARVHTAWLRAHPDLRSPPRAPLNQARPGQAERRLRHRAHSRRDGGPGPPVAPGPRVAAEPAGAPVMGASRRGLPAARPRGSAPAAGAARRRHARGSARPYPGLHRRKPPAGEPRLHLPLSNYGRAEKRRHEA